MKNVGSYASASIVNSLNTELNPICHLLALLRAHHILHVSRIRVKVKEVKVKVTLVQTREPQRGSSVIAILFL